MRTLAFILFSAACLFSQTPPIEPGVSQELAKWRAAHYSDVRYKLNLTLEKMSPVLKGTMEIRVKVSPLPSGTSGPGGMTVSKTVVRPGESSKSSPPYEGGVDAALGRRGGSLIILDWRKIKGHEDKSTISNVSINGRSADTLVRMGVASTRTSAAGPQTSIDTDSFAGGTGDADKSVRAPFEEIDEHLIFRDGVVAGENVIKLDFTSPILTSGSAITRYVDKEDGAEYIYSLFVPSDASTAFPVFDQPDLKAVFNLEVDVPQEWNVISNGVKLVSGAKTIGYSAHDPYERPPIPHDLYRHRFLNIGSNTGSSISTYVFAFAAGPWAQISEDGKVLARDTSRSPVKEPPPSSLSQNLGGRVFVRKSQAEKFKPHAAEVFRLNREAVKYFEEYFDYKFPFPKYDLVLIPEFPFGGMEHAGATFLRESAIIFPQEPTKNDHISRAVLMFHEAAHQWFGDTVTMRWFDDLWLKEGFANFAAYKAMERIMPEANAWKVFYERIKQGAYQTDSTKGTTPIYQEIKNLSAAKSAYGNIVYNKAPAFLRQAEFYLGEENFQTAVRAFLKKHEFQNAGWEDLLKEFEIASGKDPSTMKLWAEQWVKQRGLPIIRTGYSHVVSNNEIFSYGLKQKATPETNVGESNRWWTLYFNLYAKFPRKIQIKRQFLDFEGEEPWRKDLPNQTVPSFVFPNYQDYGYGIFLLDDKSRDYVLKNIQNEKDPFLRAMMWGSLWDSVREGELDPREYVELVIRNLYTTLSAEPPPIQEGSSKVQKPARSKGESEPSGESDESTIATLLNRTSTALNYYLTDTQRTKYAPVVEEMILQRLQTAETMGQRITFYRAFLNLAATENARKVLKKMLSAEAASTPPNQGGELKSVPLRTKDRFDIVTRLLILGDPDATKLLADLEKKETTDEAKRYAYAARAGIATAENKAKYWNDFVNNKEISESWIEAAFGPFNSIRHNELTLPYLQKALQELPNHKRSRKIFFVNGWLGAFIGGQRSDEALAIVNKFLADNPGLDKDLRLKILENVDVIERAVRVRAKFASR